MKAYKIKHNPSFKRHKSITNWENHKYSAGGEDIEYVLKYVSGNFWPPSDLSKLISGFYCILNVPNGLLYVLYVFLSIVVYCYEPWLQGMGDTKIEFNKQKKKHNTILFRPEADNWVVYKMALLVKRPGENKWCLKASRVGVRWG